MIYISSLDSYMSEKNGNIFDPNLIEKSELEIQGNNRTTDYLELFNIYLSQIENGRSILLKFVNREIKSLKDKMNNITKHTRWLSNQKVNNNIQSIDGLIDGCLIEREKLSKRLSYLKFISYNKDNIEHSNLLSVEKAKQCSINQFIKFNSVNKSTCLWHDDKNPSLQYYPKTNTVYCFSCKKYADVIDIVMQLTGKSFIDTIKQLQNK